MTARALLVRGLLAGALAGLLTFLVASQVGEPHLETAIAREATGAADAAGSGADHSHGAGTGGHEHDAEEDGHHGDHGAAVVGRGTQRTWGLLTGTLAIGVALGGLVALAAAAALGRLGRMQPGQSTAVVAFVGFVAVALVPFLKYPATPPGASNASTIADRTGLYFGYLAVSVVAAGLATYLGGRLSRRLGSYAGVVLGAAAYLVAVAAAAAVFAPVAEAGAFPADALWSFRLSSLLTLTTMWAVLGVVLTGLVRRLHHQEQVVLARRELAASL